MVSVAPLCIVILLHVPPADPITGWLVGPDGMLTSVIDVGTDPLHQLLAVFQSVLVLPSQMAFVELQLSSPM